MKRTLKIIAWSSVLFAGINLIPSTTVYAREELHDNKYYCERLANYHLEDPDGMWHYCADLMSGKIK